MKFPKHGSLGQYSAYLKFARCQTTRVLLYVTVSAMTFIATWLDFTFPFMTPFATIYITFVEGMSDWRILVLKQPVRKLILSLQGIIKPRVSLFTQEEKIQMIQKGSVGALNPILISAHMYNVKWWTIWKKRCGRQILKITVQEQN